MSLKYNKITTTKVCNTSESTKLIYDEYYKDFKWVYRIRIKDNSGEGYDNSEYYYLDKNSITKIKYIKYSNCKYDDYTKADNVYLKIYHTVPEGINLLIITLDQTYSSSGYGADINIKKLYKELSNWSL
jgi:hypothetical protein